MKACKYFGNHDVRLVDTEVPRPESGELLVKVLATGICGTDLHISTHGDWIGKPARPGVTMGHEFVGDVVEIGPDVQFLQKYPQVSSEISVGSRICAEPHLPCGSCWWCIRGQGNICSGIGHLGVTRDGSFAEYITVSADRCSLVPEEITNHEAAGIEPLACAVRAVHRSRMEIGDTVLVIGAGPMGQDVAKVAALSGASLVIISEPHPYRRKLAADYGFSHVLDPQETDVVGQVMELTRGIGADVAFEVAGLSETVNQAISAVRQGGRLVQVGVPTGAVTVDLRRLVIGEIELIGEHATHWDFGTAIDLIRTGRVDVTSVITHTLPLEQVLEGMELAKSSMEAVKVVLEA